METIKWTTVVELLLRYGPEVTNFVIQKINAKGEVTLAEWEQLRLLANKTAQTQLADALARNGVAPDSEQAKALFALLPK